MHLATLHKQIREVRPAALIVDPITNLMSIGNGDETRTMLTRLIDFVKSQGITAVFTSLTDGGDAMEQSGAGISSLMDTWLLVRMLESNRERNRLLYILKSRGMAHSNQMREFILTKDGIQLQDVYVGPGALLTGTARLVQEAQNRAGFLAAQQTAERRGRELAQEQASLEAQVAVLTARVASLKAERGLVETQERQRVDTARTGQSVVAAARQEDAPTPRDIARAHGRRRR
jgi:circadian clock protein KaiC